MVQDSKRLASLCASAFPARLGKLVRSCLFLGMISGVSACTVVSIEDDQRARLQQSDAFDAKAYANDIWEPKVLPALQARTQQADQLLPLLESNPTDAENKFGRRAGEGSLYTYVIRGEGLVSAIDRSTPAGFIRLQMGTRDIILQTGPYLSGASLRDSLSFISFNDFTNQIAYAGVSKALNDKALATNAATLSALEIGQTVTYSGVFAYQGSDSPILLTPVTIGLKK